MDNDEEHFLVSGLSVFGAFQLLGGKELVELEIVRVIQNKSESDNLRETKIKITD